eukprot:CAMPEP_0114581336 /NCGR_PEP_ID=MMETSP0125-20121206/5452_1 /TAXON_ID=485358 ORGANISM="Aristerostoma sp., Strain ATCC 50986" /NCGR_SAMPLE_ID=MMETSP0125 /ASSEMBLY_ACC=CAM_ASM_000245 /LENGTH=92 /DNA_ID=CAMNT_0001773457 /DNA_START=49 /DNA_END=327 /DNA_ORIENTATION=+
MSGTKPNHHPPTKLDEDTVNNNLIRLFEKLQHLKEVENEKLQKKIADLEAKLEESSKFKARSELLEAQNERLNDLVMEQARQIGKMTFFIEE